MDKVFINNTIFYKSLYTQNNIVYNLFLKYFIIESGIES